MSEEKKKGGVRVEWIRQKEGTLHASSEAAMDAALADLAAQKEREERQRMLWGDANDNRERMRRLCARFPSLARLEGAGVGRWNEDAVLAWTCSGISHGEALAGRFVLSVWNSATDWNEIAHADGLLEEGAALRRFDLFEAWGVWDLEHREAALAWLGDPFWP